MCVIDMRKLATLSLKIFDKMTHLTVILKIDRFVHDIDRIVLATLYTTMF